MLDQLRRVGLVTEPAPAVTLPEEPGVRLAEEVRRVFGRSLHIRQVDAGSCNGCELEIANLGNPYYDLERFGLHFVASPRHADCLLVTGPVTRNMAEPLRRTWEATPAPKLVVAAGDCALDAGIFRGSYAVVGGAGDRPVVRELAGARVCRAEQHRSGLPALQQELQPLLLRERPIGGSS